MLAVFKSRCIILLVWIWSNARHSCRKMKITSCYRKYRMDCCRALICLYKSPPSAYSMTMSSMPPFSIESSHRIMCGLLHRDRHFTSLVTKPRSLLLMLFRSMTLAARVRPVALSSTRQALPKLPWPSNLRLMYLQFGVVPKIPYNGSLFEVRSPLLLLLLLPVFVFVFKLLLLLMSVCVGRLLEGIDIGDDGGGCGSPFLPVFGWNVLPGYVIANKIY